MLRARSREVQQRVVDRVIVLVWLVVFMVCALGIGFPILFFMTLEGVYKDQQEIVVKFSRAYLENYLNYQRDVVTQAARAAPLQDPALFGRIRRETRGVPPQAGLAAREVLRGVLSQSSAFRFLAFLTPDEVRPVLLEPTALQMALTEGQYDRGYAWREWASGCRDNYRMWARGAGYPAPFLSDGFISQPGDVPAVSLSVAVVDQRKEMVGILYANISLAHFSDFVRTLSYGRTGKVFVVDGVGNLVAHPDLSPDIRSATGLSLRNLGEVPMVRRALAGVFRPGLFYDPSYGKTVIATYAGVPGSRWIVVAEQDADDAFSVIRGYLAAVLILAFASVLVSVRVFSLVSRETAEATRQHRELVVISETDPLTGLLNRRSMLSRMSHIVEDSESSGNPFVIAMFDIDDFKRVNDTYGHVFGDLVLREIAARSVGTLRVEDLLFRWGGEEFLLVVRNSDLSRGRAVAEKIRRVVGDTPISDGRVSVTVTITLGVCLYRGAPIDRMIVDADAALYEGKRAGKNRVVVSED